MRKSFIVDEDFNDSRLDRWFKQKVINLPHSLIEKIIRQNKKYHAHDENNEFKIGYTVSIIESRPISKLKKWKVISNTGENSWYKCNLIFL